MVVCFIGHRKIEINDCLRSRIAKTILQLIDCKFDIFLFGSANDFDCLCWSAVRDFCKNNDKLKTICYSLPHEYAFISKNEADSIAKLCAGIVHRAITFRYFDEVRKISVGGRKSYIIRNRKMIDDSDACVFLYDENYLPPKSKNEEQNSNAVQSASGTAVAYNYAIRKNKVVINLFQND